MELVPLKELREEEENNLPQMKKLFFLYVSLSETYKKKNNSDG